MRLLLHVPLAPTAPRVDARALGSAPRVAEADPEDSLAARVAAEVADRERVRQDARREPIQGYRGRIFSFALGMPADDEERPMRTHELGAARPSKPAR